jgi:hypothetical protein
MPHRKADYRRVLVANPTERLVENMRRLLSVTVPALIALAMPALAQAQTGTVLSVARGHHQLQLIGSNKVVSAYHFSGRLPGVHRGTKLDFSARGSHIVSPKVVGTATTFSFLATVVRSGSGALVLSLGDSRRLRLTGKVQSRAAHTVRGARLSAHDAGNITVEINGLQPGQTVVVTESTDASGNVTITITLPTTSGGGSGDPGSNWGSDQTASGLVNSVGSYTFDVITSGGQDLTFHMHPDALSSVGMSSCDAVVVEYHTYGQTLIADNVTDNGAPDAGPCSSGGDNAGNWTGTITAVSPTAITVDAGPSNGGAETFAVDDPAITEGYIVGDSVTVTYEPWNGLIVADQVSYNDSSTSGQVTAIADAGGGFSTLTVIDDYTTEPETFFVAQDLLQGQDVQVGDNVTVSYYQAARGLTLDCLTDNGPAEPGDGDSDDDGGSGGSGDSGPSGD